MVSLGFYDVVLADRLVPGRLLYTSGDLNKAVDFLLRLLRGPSLFSANSAIQAESNTRPPSNDKIYLEDLRVAYSVREYPCVDF